MKKKMKIIWIAVATLVLVGMAGCDMLNTVSETPKDPVGTVEAFIDAYNNKDEKRMIELSTTELFEEIKGHDYINRGLWGMKYAKLESASVYQETTDNATVLCSWDNKTIEEAKKEGKQTWSFVSLVRENGLWKVNAGGGSGAPDGSSQNDINGAFEVLEKFLEANNNKDEEEMIKLSTTEMVKKIKEHDFINIGLGGMKYTKLESATIYEKNDEDSVVVLCSWDEKTIEECKKKGMQSWNLATLVRENGIWKVSDINV
jgi:hypothetical protein